MDEVRRLNRSPREAVLGGVCAGLARYLEVDATLVRVGAVLLTLLFPPLLLVYVAAWILVPAGADEPASPAFERGEALRERVVESARRGVESARQRRSPETVLGVVLLLAGLYFLMERLGVFDLWIFRWMTWDRLWPVALILLGVALIVRGLSASRDGTKAASATGSAAGGAPEATGPAEPPAGPAAQPPDEPPAPPPSGTGEPQL